MNIFLSKFAYIIFHPTFKFDDEIRADEGRSGVYSACNIAQRSAISLYIFPYSAIPRAPSNLLQSCRFPGFKLQLSDGLMLQSRIWERGSGRCVLWVTVATGCGCQHRKCDIFATPACFQARLGLRVAGNHKHLKNFVMEPIEGVGGKRWAKMLRYICLC